MGLTVEQNYFFGGVDSRSSALLLPTNRCLRCLNWVPQEAGFLQLRYGYTQVAMTSPTATAIHSIQHFKTLSGSQKSILYGQGSALKLHNLSTGAQTTPTNRGAALSGSGKWMWAKANNRLHGTNGTVMKQFDGTTLRDLQPRALTADEVASVLVDYGMRDYGAMVAITSGASAGGGSFTLPLYGYFVYVVAFDKATNDMAPAATPANNIRIVTSAGGKIDLSNLVDPSSIGFSATTIKLLAITLDGRQDAYFNTTTSTNIVNITRSGTTATLNAVGHGLSVGDPVIIAHNTETIYNDVWAVASVPDADHVTFTLKSADGATGTGGTVKRINFVAAATTVGTITSPTVDTSFAANAQRGIPVSSITTGTNVSGGYQYYAAIYNATTGDVGNRIPIGVRFSPTLRTTVRITGLPTLAGEDSEWSYIIGRTGDGGEVPYVVADDAGNWITSENDGTIRLIDAAQIDANYELPSRSSVPPTLDMIVRVGDKLYGVESGSATIRSSESMFGSREGIFLGNPEHAWPANNIETFPTGEAVSCLAESEQVLFAFSLKDMAGLVEVNGVPQWLGPWYGAGCAGKFAFANTPYGPFWITGEKQLATIGSNGKPGSASGEYETALLSQIGDAYLSDTQLAHIVDSSKNIDTLVIKARKSDGSPFHVYHDFKLRDGQSPIGQGYTSEYEGELASDYVIAQVRDVNDKLRIWAGGADGRFYQLLDGDNDNGTEYDADWITLINGGKDRASVPYLHWHGDRMLEVQMGRSLKADIDPGGEDDFVVLCGAGTAQQVGFTGEKNYYYEAKNDHAEVEFAYLRLKLTSHSTDGTLALNDPPHIPIENYGRVYAVMPVIEGTRGAR